MKKLTIGMATYDDYDGVYFTIQALRMYHPICNTAAVEFVVIDNNPSSAHGKATKQFIENTIHGKYIPYTEKSSSFTKYDIVKYASGEYILGLDCHVLLKSGAIDALLNYYSENLDTIDLIQGPLLLDGLDHVSTHFKEEFRGGMWGTWDTDNQYKAGEPFEIPMNGMGLFSFRKAAWPGINPNFRGFGAEEGYIQAKFAQNGGKTMCLPALQWNHRFGRPAGVPYRLNLEDRIFNYFLGWYEIYNDKNHVFIKQIIEHFSKFIPLNKIQLLLDEAIELNSKKMYILEILNDYS